MRKVIQKLYKNPVKKYDKYTAFLKALEIDKDLGYGFLFLTNKGRVYIRTLDPALYLSNKTDNSINEKPQFNSYTFIDYKDLYFLDEIKTDKEFQILKNGIKLDINSKDSKKIIDVLKSKEIIPTPYGEYWIDWKKEISGKIEDGIPVAYLKSPNFLLTENEFIGFNEKNNKVKGIIITERKEDEIKEEIEEKYDKKLNIFGFELKKIKKKKEYWKIEFDMMNVEDGQYFDTTISSFYFINTEKDKVYKYDFEDMRKNEISVKNSQLVINRLHAFITPNDDIEEYKKTIPYEVIEIIPLPISMLLKVIYKQHQSFINHNKDSSDIWRYYNIFKGGYKWKK